MLITPLLAILAANVFPIEGPEQAAWLHARCEVAPLEGGLAVSYDFSEGRPSCWFRRAYGEPQDLSGYAFLRFTLTGAGHGARVMTYLILLDDGEERAFASLPIVVDFSGPRTFSVRLDTLRLEGACITGAELKRVRQVNFSLSRGEHDGGRVEVTAIGFADEPEGVVIELPRADLSLLPEGKLIEAVDWPEGVEPGFEGFGAYLGSRKTPRFFFDGRDRAAFVPILQERYKGWMEGKKRDADSRIMPRTFKFEGDERQLSDPIEWYQGRIEWSHILNRLQYLESLYAAYWLTGDEVYAADCVKLLNDWIDHCPPPKFIDENIYGQPWRSLEAGIRCDTMLRAYYALLGSPSFTATDRAKMGRSLAEHARYLAAFQEVHGYRPGNFQVVECAGLAMVGIMFPEFLEAPSWRETGLRWLYRHMAEDVYADGTHWECTPGYHNWVAERFATVWQLATMNGTAIDGEFTRKLKGMFEFDLKVMSPTYNPPMNGDCGRYSARGWLALGAFLFDDPVLRYGAVGEMPLNVFWLAGAEGFERYAALKPQEPPFTSVLLPDSGFGIMRTGWSRNDSWFFFDTVQYGGGHSHPDQLSFEFQYGPVLIFGDSGRLNYNTPLHREYMRSAPAHNVCAIDGRFADRTASPERLEWRDEEAFVVARGRVPVSGHVWERGVLWVKPDVWVVRDLFLGEGEHTVERYFNHVPAYGDNVPDLEARAKLGVSDVWDCVHLEDGERRVEAGWFGISASTALEAETSVVSSTLTFPATRWCALGPGMKGRGVRVLTSTTEELGLEIGPAGGENSTAKVVRWTWPEGPGESQVSIASP